MAQLTREQLLMIAHAKQSPDPMVDTAKGTGSGVLGGLASTLDSMGNIAGVGVPQAAFKASQALSGQDVQPHPDEGLFANLKDFFFPQNGPAQTIAEAALPGAQGFQPQTEPGKFGKQIGSFIGSDIPTMGMGGIGRTLLSDIAGGAASQAAGEHWQGKTLFGQDIGPWAQVLAGIGGSAGVAGMPNPRRPDYRAAKQAAGDGSIPTVPGVMAGGHKGAISAEDLKTATDAFYDHLRQMNIQYDPGKWQQFLTSATRKMESDFHRKPVAGSKGNLAADPMFEVLDRELRQTLMTGQAPDFNDLDKLSVNLGKLARDADKLSIGGKSVLGDAYHAVRNEVDSFIANSSFTVGGQPVHAANKLVSETYKTAKTIALRNIKQRRIAEMVEAAQDYNSGFVAGLTNQINNELRRTGPVKFWTAGERKLLRDVAKGNTPLGILGTFGFDPARWGGGGVAAAGDIAKSAATNTLTGGIGAIASGNPMLAAATVPAFAAGTLYNLYGKEPVLRHDMENAAAAIRGGGQDKAAKAVARETNRRRMRELMSVTHTMESPLIDDQSGIVTKTPRG